MLNSSEIRVLLISPLPPPSGGIGTWTKKYIAHAKEYSINVDIVNIATIGRRSLKLNQKRSFKDEIVRTYRIINDLRDRLKNDNYDVVHLNTSCEKYGLFRDYICAFIIKKKKIPLIIHCRCDVGYQLKNGSFEVVFRHLVRISDRVITLNSRSKGIADKYAKKESVIIPNFIEDDYLKGDYHIRDNIKKIVFVGHVEFAKGIKEIIDAANAYRNISFWIIGSIRDEVNSLTIPENVHMVGDIQHDSIKEYLMESDVFLFPSYSEGFANALLEAMACGLPCIVSDVGANVDMIEDSGGYSVSIKNSKEIVNAINKLEDPRIRHRMSIWNKEKVKLNYTIDSVMKRIIEIYFNVIQERRGY